MLRTSHRCALLITLGLSAVAASPTSARQSGDGAQQLYHRLGGYDVIAGVVDDFIARFDADPALAPFLGGINAAAGGRIRQHFIDFICAETGGPCLYNGRDMDSTHEGLPIEKTHFDAVMRHFDAALRGKEVPAAARDELLRRLRGLEPRIVRDEPSSESL